MSHVHGPKLLGTAGMIAKTNDAEGQPHWAYSLLRREFSFSDINGIVDRLEIRCDWRRAIDTIDAERVWEVPKSWGSCRIFVFGDPGSTFQLIEHPGPPGEDRGLMQIGFAPVQTKH